MRTVAQTTIAAPVETVWGFVSDPRAGTELHVRRDPMGGGGEQPSGLGARYRMLMRVGSAEIGGLIEIVEYEAPRELAWNSVTGIDQRGRWRLRPAPGGRTRAEIRLSYGVAGAGLSGWIAERIAGPAVSAHLRNTVAQLRRIVEYEHSRDLAAQRRAARTG